jgi:hypothetical protein
LKLDVRPIGRLQTILLAIVYKGYDNMEPNTIRIAQSHVQPIEDVDTMRALYPAYQLPDLPSIRACPRIPGVEANIWRLIYILAGELVFRKMPSEPESNWIQYHITEEVSRDSLTSYLEKIGVPEERITDAAETLQRRGVPILDVESVGIRTADGNWVSAHLEMDAVCRADAEGPADWARFGSVSLGETKIALMAFNGKWVGAHLETDGTLKADIGFRHDWEEFDVVQMEDGKIALKAFNGKWVGFRPDSQKTLKADADDVSTLETFELVQL